jgi:hypothetical protein
VADLKLLGTYLNDHLAGSTVGCELSRRAAGNNEGTPLGAFLTNIAGEIEEDRDTLVAIMDRLGVGKKVGRLKPNNSLFSYSPLSRVVELEGLALGVEGKRSLWQALRQLDEPLLTEFDFDALLERARTQRDQLQEHRLAASRDAFEG